MKRKPAWRVVRGAWLIVLMACAISCLESADLSAAPTLEPAPRTEPLRPGREEDATPEQRMLWRLGALLQDYDRRISELGAQVPSGMPPPANTDPALDAPRRERDKALGELRDILASYGQRQSVGSDAIEVARPAAKAAQVGMVAAVNQMRIAECCQQLLQGGAGTADDLRVGIEALTASDPSVLPPFEQPRYHFLRVWFAAEAARRATGEVRARHLATAQEAQRLLLERFPASDLTAVAQTLTMDLTTASAPTP